MRRSLQAIIHRYSDPAEQQKELEKLVRDGELQEFKVGNITVCFIDPKADKKKEAVLHLTTLHELQALLGFAKSKGDHDQVSLYGDAILRLKEIYPEMEGFEGLYETRITKMRSGEML